MPSILVVTGSVRPNSVNAKVVPLVVDAPGLLAKLRRAVEPPRSAWVITLVYPDGVPGMTDEVVYLTS